MKAVVLAGGNKVKRFKTYFLGKMVIEYPLRALEKVYDVALLTSGWGLDGYETVVQRSPGVLGAIRDAVEELGLPLLISYGDVVAEEDFYTILDAPCGVAAVASVPSSRHGKIGGPQSSYVFGGLLSLDEDCYKEIMKIGNLTKALNELIKKGIMSVKMFDGVWYDVDDPLDVMRMFEVFFKHVSSGYSKVAIELEGVHLRGPVIVEPGASVEPGATLIGPVFVGSGSLVESHAVVKRSSIEPNATVESFAYVKNSSVQPGAVAESYKKYSGTLVEKNL